MCMSNVLHLRSSGTIKVHSSEGLFLKPVAVSSQEKKGFDISNLKVFCLGVGLQTCSVTVGKIRWFKTIKPSDMSILPQRNGHFYCGTVACIPSENCYGRNKKMCKKHCVKKRPFLNQGQHIPHLIKKGRILSTAWQRWWSLMWGKALTWCWLWRTHKCHLRLSGIFLWHIAQ